MEQAAAHAQNLGHIPFASRPAEVQTVVATMYGNSSRIRTASGVFVNQAPLSAPGSMTFDNSALGSYVIAEYPNTTSPSGTPSEVVVADESQVQLYSPRNNTTTSTGFPPGEELPPVATIPVGRIVSDMSSSTLTGGNLGRGLAGFANLFLHPTYLVTSRFFTNKNVAVVEGGIFGGQEAWELEGTQVASDPQASLLGNRWRMWVDKETGVILRLEYCSGSQLLGWAEMRDLVINGRGASFSSLVATAWSIPSTAQRVDSDTYTRLPRS